MFSKQMLFGATLAASAVAQTTTVNALIGPSNTASVVSADCSSTILAIGCEGSDNEYCQQAAQYGGSTVTLTVGPTAVQLNYATSSSNPDLTASVAFSCDYLGPSPSFTSQSCSLSLSINGGGISTDLATTVAQSVTVTPEPLTITGGADKLTCGGSGGAGASATSTGASSTHTGTSQTGTSSGAGASAASTGASSTSKAAAAAATAVPVVYKVLVPVGAAFVAGAAYL